MNKATVTANPGESTIRVERTFDASPEKFFRVLTNKELVPKWWAGPGYEVRVDEMDVREGGRWKFVQVMQDGKEFPFFGSYHEVTPAQRVIQTFEFGGMPERGHALLEKMEMQPTEDGKTKMTVTQAFFSVEDRDGLLKNGMEEGMQKTYAVLDKLLAEAE